MSSSLSNISQTSSDLAPDTPSKSLSLAPSPSHPADARPPTKAPAPGRKSSFSRHDTADENVSNNLQQPLVGTVIEMQHFASDEHASANGSEDSMQCSGHDRQLLNMNDTNDKAQHSPDQNKPDGLLQATRVSENDPLLAASARNILSDHPAQSAGLELQGMMLHDKHEADDAAEQLGMTPSALKVGIRSAVVAMNLSEGPSENATEALEAFGAAGNSPKTLEAAADAPEALDTAGKAGSKGRIMKVGPS